MMGAPNRAGWVLLGLLAAGSAVNGQTRETLACVVRLELPYYQPLARDARVEGTAVASFTVGGDGRLREINVEASHESSCGGL